jgi:hypothetical protein
MAASKFLKQVGGAFQEETPGATGGAPDAYKIPALDANGQLTAAMMPTGIGADTVVLPASENLSAGAFVNIYSNAGTENARNADASGGKPAQGFVLAAVTAGQNATVYLNGVNNQVTGATPGPVFLSDSTPGAATSTAPTASGHIVQKLGDAVSATQIHFVRQPEVTLA